MNIDVIMRNPLDYGLESVTMVFDVMVRSKQDGVTLTLDDFAFYIMDEDNRLYNTRNSSHSELGSAAEAVIEDTRHTSRGLILTELRHEWLYQDMRLLFCRKPDARFGVIKLYQG
jgi:hypothetical protein